MALEEATAQGALGRTGLSEARAQLSAVAQELADIQTTFYRENGTPSSGNDQDPRDLPDDLCVLLDLKASLRDREAAWRRLRHMQVDLEEYKVKAERLARENEELQAAKRSLAVQLRGTRRGLAEAGRRLRHREAEDMPKEDFPGRLLPQLSPSLAAIEQEADELAFTMDTMASRALQAVSGRRGPRNARTHRGGPPPAGGKQAQACLRAVQAELQSEQARRRQVEASVRQEQRKSAELSALVEKQREELAALQRPRIEEEFSEPHPDEHEVRLEPGTAPEPTNLFQLSFQRRAGSALLSCRRQQSAPTLLPPVGRRNTFM